MIRAALVAVLAAGLVAGCRQAPKAAGTPPPPSQGPNAAGLPPASGEGVGKPAPDFSVVDVDGNRHSRGDYGGRVVVLDFWATYCKPCVKKLAEYKEKYADYHSRDVDFLALSMDESDEVIKGWRQKQPEGEFPFPLARLDDDNRKAFFGDMPLVPIPQVRIIDRKGIVRYAFGPEATSDQVLSAVQTLLDEKR